MTLETSAKAQDGKKRRSKAHRGGGKGWMDVGKYIKGGVVSVRAHSWHTAQRCYGRGILISSYQNGWNIRDTYMSDSRTAR